MKRAACLALLVALLLSGCQSADDNTMRVVANGRVFFVPTMTSAQDRYLEVDGLREVLTHIGATVDVNGGDRLMAIAFPAGDDTVQNWPPAPADAAYTVVFNDQVLHTSWLDDEGRPYLPLGAFRSLCVAMRRRVSPPPYDRIIAIVPPDGEALPGASTPGAADHAVQLPGKGGH